MTIATTDQERVPLAPVQQRVENHMDISTTFDMAHRDSGVKVKLLETDTHIDTIGDLRRRSLVNDLYEALAVLDSYCTDDGSRAAFENVSASARAYVAFEDGDEQREDASRGALTFAERRTRKTMGSARKWSRAIVPDCTGENPEPAA